MRRSLETAVGFQDVGLIWDVWCEQAEANLSELTSLETGNEVNATSNKYRGRGHAASTRKVRLGSQGRKLEGVEMDPEMRGVKKLHNILGEMVAAKDTMSDEHFRDLWSKACRLGTEFLKGKIVSFRWSEVPTKEVLTKIRGEVQEVLEQALTGGWERIRTGGKSETRKLT